MALATILIAVRNAAETIQRAIFSAVGQGNYPIFLIDDFSIDQTVALAREIAGNRLRVVRPREHRTLGLTRQTGLFAVETPYGVWLDADDELLPGRVERMVAALEHDRSQIVSDGMELFDGVEAVFKDVLCIPPFLEGFHPPARLFERNYLPGIGVVGFRTDFAQQIGFDIALHGGEDMDFALRALAAGGGFSLLDNIGYRAFAYPNSLSRQLNNQRGMYRVSLLKHDYEDVRRLYRQAGYSARITAWGLVSMATFREEYPRALEFLSEAASLIDDPFEVLEPTGPCPLPEEWRFCFHRGTLLLLVGRVSEAIGLLESAEQIRPSAEGANNLGIAKMKLGDLAGGKRLFTASLERFPGFLDAKINVEAPDPSRITTHPLRSGPSRTDYAWTGP